MTTMIDVYEACGAKVNEDRTQVEISAHSLKPFDMLLRVIPTTVEMQYGEPEKVTFGVLLDPEMHFHDQVVTQVYYDESVSMPVNQVRISPNSGSLSTADELRELPPGTVIAGPNWNDEIYQHTGNGVFYAIAQETPWSADILNGRGPFSILKRGDS